MEHYNMLSEVHPENERLRAWRFRVKILRVHSLECFGLRPFWSFILADEAGNKTELIIPPAEASKYKGLEDQEGNWILISRVEVKPAFSGFKHVNCPFILTVIEGTRIYPLSQQNDRHYIEFKSIHEIKHISNIDVPIDVMGVLFNVEPLEVCSSDHKMSSITFYIKDNLDNQIKCIAYGDTAYRFRDVNASNVGTGVVIVVLTMWRVCKWREEEPWIKSHNGLSDFRFNPWMTEVDEFRRQLAL